MWWWASLAQLVCHAVRSSCQVGELFLPSGRGADASCLLQQRCREDESDYSELLFGGRSSSAAAPQQQQGGAKDAGGAPAPEAEAWKRTNRAVVERLAALSSGQVGRSERGLGVFASCHFRTRMIGSGVRCVCLATQPMAIALPAPCYATMVFALPGCCAHTRSGTGPVPMQVEHACAGWLRAVAEDFSAACGPLLSGLTTAVSLVQVEAQVRAAIADWQHPGAAAGGTAASGKAQPAKRARTGPTVAASALGGATSASGVIAPAGSLGRHGHGHGHNHAHVHGHGHGVSDASPHLGSWEAVCEWVVGRQLSLWQEVFHAPFVARSRELIEQGFAALGRSVEGPLDACLAAAAAAEPEPAGCILTRAWPLEGWEGGAGTAAAAAAGVDGAGRYAAAGRSADLRGAGVGEEAGGAGAGGKAGGKAVDRSYRQQVAAMQRKFDEDMLAMLQVRVWMCYTRQPHRFLTAASLSPRAAVISHVDVHNSTLRTHAPVCTPAGILQTTLYHVVVSPAPRPCCCWWALRMPRRCPPPSTARPCRTQRRPPLCRGPPPRRWPPRRAAARGSCAAPPPCTPPPSGATCRAAARPSWSRSCRAAAPSSSTRSHHGGWAGHVQGVGLRQAT